MVGTEELERKAMWVRDDARSIDKSEEDQFLAPRSRVQERGSKGIYSKEGLVKLVSRTRRCVFSGAPLCQRLQGPLYWIVYW